MSTSAAAVWQKPLELEQPVPEESPLTIRVNGHELVTLMCSRTYVTQLVVGFLYLQGIINDISQLGCLRVCEQDLVADVTISNPFYEEDFRQCRAITSGCTGGVLKLNETLRPIGDGINTILTGRQMAGLLKQLYQQAVGYQATGGMHSSALSIDGEQLLVQAEDIGRHNTIDKVAGFCMLSGCSSKGGVMLTTGRISLEMVVKATKLQTPILVSRTAPTSLAVQLAEEMGITLVGYARAGKFVVYTCPWRIKN